LAQLGADRAAFVLIFGRLSRRRREALAKVLRRDRRVAIVIDEVLLLHLISARENYLELLFTCAAPFGWMQPYTTKPGMIPPEMFFGREDEMARIVERGSGGCLVYGGRQLGKSALLNHVRRLHHRPDDGQIALYLDIKPIGDAAIPATSVWSEVSSALQRERINQEHSADALVVEAKIREWLKARPDRRILLMLDEADRFLRAENSAGYPNLQRLKSLMETTNWRFKAVFAGLHNVLRMAQAPNSPLVHLGDPICIGPMNSTPRNKAEARRLAVAPMRSAGFDYNPPSLAWDMLARVNHYPSLVQVFCKSVIEAIGMHSRSSLEAGPRWKLSRDVLFEGSVARGIADEIKKRFQWTLDLDPRYELIAKCMALHRLESPDGHEAILRRGLAVEDIERKIAIWWPASMQRMRRGDLEEILDEMVNLGVLARYAKSRFGLRSAHVAQMLGQSDEIARSIISVSEREPDIDYDASTFHRRISIGSTLPRCPLPDRQFASLVDSKIPGARVLRTAKLVVGENFSRELADAIESWQKVDPSQPPISVKQVKGSASNVRAALDQSKVGRHVIVLDTALDSSSVSFVNSHKGVKEGRILPIWIVPLSMVVPPSLGIPNSLIFRASCWGEPMLRHWLREEGLGSLDDSAARRDILEASGGLPDRLVKLRPILEQVSSDTADRRHSRIGEWNRANPLKGTAIGLPADILEHLKTIQEFGGEIETSDDLLNLVGEAAGEVASRLKDMGLAELFRADGLRLLPLGKLVKV
jgi:hypothetical protein